METRRRSLLKEIRNRDGSKRSANWDLLADLIHSADVVLEIVDARDIRGTRLQDAERWAGSNRLLIIVNKFDLVSLNFKKPNLPENTLYISAKDRTSKTRNLVLAAIKARARSLPAKGVVVGYPNVGKSSVINMLAHKEAAKISPIAGTTTNVQWVRVADDVLINDYPGVFPSVENKDELFRKGALNVHADAERYAHKFAKKILASKILQKWVEKKFDIDIHSAKDSEDILVILAERRKWYLKGGIPNTEEASKALVRAMMEAPEI